jgi:hypothetical protein
LSNSILVEFVYRVGKWGGEIPILQMNNALNSNLRDIVQVEQDICDDGETEENAGCYEEEERVEVCFLGGLGCCDAVGF